MANSSVAYTRLPNDEDTQTADPPPYTAEASSSAQSAVSSSTTSPSRGNILAGRMLLPPAAAPPPYSATAPSTESPPSASATVDQPETPDPQSAPVIIRGPADSSPTEQTAGAGHIAQTTDPQASSGQGNGDDTELTLLRERRGPEIVHGEQFQAPDTNSLICMPGVKLLFV